MVSTAELNLNERKESFQDRALFLIETGILNSSLENVLIGSWS